MKNIFQSLLTTLFVFAIVSFASAQPPVKLTLSNVNGSPGDTVCVDFKVDNFTNIQGMSFTIAWNSTKLDFVNISNFNPGVNSNQFFSASPSAGKQTLLYANPQGTGTTLPDGSIVMSACFKIKMPVGQLDSILITGSPTAIEFSNNTGDVLPTIIKNGSVKSVLPDLKPLKLIGSYETVKKGDTVCVSYTVEDFTKIKTWETRINWDITKLKFEYISMVNNQIDPTGTTPWYATIVAPFSFMDIKWSAAKAGINNLTLPNGTTVFKICFKVIGDEGDVTTLPTSSTSPNAPVVITSTSNNGNVGQSGTNGKVKILQTKFNPVIISSSNYTGDAGQDFCVDIKASNVDSIIAMQFSLQWDPELLAFKEIKDVNPFFPGVTAAFNTINSKVDGSMAFTVDVPGVGTINLAPNTSLFKVCFTPTGLLGCDKINLTKIPIDIQAYNNQTLTGIGVDDKLGKICIQSAIKIADTTIVRPTCGNPLGGSIKMNVIGGQSPYTFQWSPNAYNAKTKDVDKLPQGVFYVTIVDSAIPVNKVTVKYEIIGDTKPPKAVAKAIGILECKANSMVTLDGTGSTTGPNIKYQWKSDNGIFTGAPGSDTTLITKCSSASKYYLEIINTKNGCVDTSNLVTISDKNVPNADAGPNQFLACTNLIGVLLDGCNSSSGANYKMSWSAADGGAFGPPNSSQNPTKCNPIALKPGTYYLTVTNTATQCTAVEKTVVTADPNTPIAMAEVKDTINCDNSTVQLFGDNSLNVKGGSGAGLTYSWSALDKGIVTNTKNSVAIAENADRFILLVKNANGCLATDTVTVYDLRADTAFIKMPSDIKLSCQGLSTVIDASQSSSPLKNFVYQWAVAPNSSGNIVSGENTPKLTVNQQGKYILTVTHKYSKCTAVASINVFAADAPASVDAGKDTTLTCTVKSIVLTGNTSQSSPTYVYKWTTKNGGNILNGATVNPSVTKPGLYVFEVVDSKNGCKSVDSVEVKENKEAPKAKINGEKELTCGKDFILLSGTNSSNADNYIWTTSNGGQIDAGLGTQTVNVSKPGSYTLKVTRNDNGCADSIKQIITFKYPEKGYAGLDTLICTAKAVTLTATVVGGGSGYWTALGKGVVKDQSNNVTEVDSLVTGKNTFVWTSSAPGCPDFAADTIVVFVEKGLKAKDDLVTQKNKSEYFNVPVTINDDIKGIKAWTLKAIGKPEYGNLDTTATKTGFKYKPSECYAGSLAFKYVITSKYCPQYKDTATVKLLITSDPAACNDVTIPNTITPNGDGLNDGFRIDAIEFQPERFKNAQLTVFNRWGDVVYKKTPYKNEWFGTNQDGKDLPEGTYYYILDLNLPDGVNFRGDITIL